MVDGLDQRRKWLSYFPEGTLEFLVVTRVLILLLLAALIIVPTTQRPTVLLAMMTILWCDYALLLSWLIQLVGDLEHLFESSASGSRQESVRLTDSVVAFLPSILALLLVVPWPAVVLRKIGHPTPLTIGLLVLFLISLPLGYGALRRMGFRGGVGTLLLLVPFLQYFVLHRFLPRLHARVRERALDLKLPVSQETGAGAAAVAADFFLILGAIFWVGWALLLWRARHTGSSGGVGLGLVQVVSLVAGCLMAVTQIGALEYLQRRYVTLVRRSGDATAAQQGSQT